ncbi:MAG: integrase, partial [Nitrosopumilus sp. H13]
MKLTRDEFERIGTEPPLELFRQGIKAEETKEKYTRTLRQVLCKILGEILEGDFEQRVEQLVRYGRENPDWTRDLLLNISKKLRERTELPHNHPDYCNQVSFNAYFKPIKKLFDMNDIVIPWKRVYATFPEIDNVSESRGWSRDEIQKMLKFARGPMDRAIVLIAASSGMRAGGFDLDWDAPANPRWSNN